MSFVPTAENIADILTKAMKDAEQFHKLRKVMMNDHRDYAACPPVHDHVPRGDRVFRGGASPTRQGR